MTILLLLIPLGLLLLAVAVGFFVWAVRHDQFEGLESEGARILFDPDRPAPRPSAGAGSPAASSGDTGPDSGSA
jgi:cbb3-type cytochrome oxidase maturation protein